MSLNPSGSDGRPQPSSRRPYGCEIRSHLLFFRSLIKGGNYCFLSSSFICRLIRNEFCGGGEEACESVLRPQKPAVDSVLVDGVRGLESGQTEAQTPFYKTSKMSLYPLSSLLIFCFLSSSDPFVPSPSFLVIRGEIYRDR